MIADDRATTATHDGRTAGAMIADDHAAAATAPPTTTAAVAMSCVRSAANHHAKN
jgi:hypothetical protein